MLTYKEYEKAVFDWLLDKNKKDGFTFSLRQVASKGAESDYFIGTGKSNYFATTFWTLPVSYPGSSGDCISLIFKYIGKDLIYYFDLNQTTNPQNLQNRSALNLIESLIDPLREVFDIRKDINAEARIYNAQFKSIKSSYTDITSMMKDLDIQLDKFIPIVNHQIEEEKVRNGSFIAHRISQSEFDKFLTNVENRLEKYSKAPKQTAQYEITTSLGEEEIFNQKVKPIIPLNQILYGPPGTGKTYNTINKTLQIVDSEFYHQNYDKRDLLKERYLQLQEAGHISFVTFHQSMGYEDFIEGIKPLKPDEDDGSVKYDVVDGIFKTLCNNAKKITVKESSINWEKAEYYKVSLGGKNRQSVHDYCIDNNVISIGYGGDKDLSHLKRTTNWEEFKVAFTKINQTFVEETKYNIQAAYYFLTMAIGDIVVVSKGNAIIDAIGVIEGDYFYDEKSPIDFLHYRKVNWLATNLNLPPNRFFKKKISQMTIYGFYKQDIKIDAFKELFQKSNKVESKPYVLIIDEINRGNVSQIFGELITLIEGNKRLGEKEALTVTLPYSKENFGVPNNLYIIGTMNTADRSVEALDTALRRRFSFIQMMPEPNLIRTEGVLKENEGSLFIDERYIVDLASLLETINERIRVLLDADHQIGHSYLINVKSVDDLVDAFNNCIIPLLQEYFYHDEEKIALVLGEGFVGVENKEILPADIFPRLSFSHRLPAARPQYILKEINAGNIIEALNYLTKSHAESYPGI